MASANGPNGTANWKEITLTAFNAMRKPLYSSSVPSIANSSVSRVVNEVGANDGGAEDDCSGDRALDSEYDSRIEEDLVLDMNLDFRSNVGSSLLAGLVVVTSQAGEDVADHSASLLEVVEEEEEDAGVNTAAIGLRVLTVVVVDD